MTRPLTVLFVDDDPDDVDLERAALRHEFAADGRRVETADAFMAALREGDAEVILCDYSVPGFSGMDALKLWQESNAAIPFLFVTGRLSGSARARRGIRILPISSRFTLLWRGLLLQQYSSERS